MKSLLIGVGSLGLLIVLVAAIGALLPRRHRAARSVVLRQPATTLFAALRDFAGQPAWRSNVKQIELLPPVESRVHYRETTRDGAITYAVVEEQPPARLVVKIANESLPFGGTWTFQLAPEGEATRVTITEDGEVKNVIFRFMARFVFGHTATLDRYLHDLAAKFGEPGTPVT
jgi:hypothetical protein